MSKARVLADLVAAGGELADGAIAVAEVTGAAPLASPTFTGTATAPTINASTALQIGGTAITSTAAELNKLDGVTASAAELSHTTGVTSAIQTQIDTKQKELTPNVITSSTTGAKDNRYFLNGATITLTLPSSASAGDTIAISEMGGNSDNVIGRNGHNIQSLGEDMTIDTAYAAFQLQYVNATVGWAISQ
tara:strand:+ start:334 stop:906 length:573 start_codon:yes stop_codon:yes gene_type:complete